MRVLICYNAPLLPPEHPDYASEAGVLEAVDAFREAVERAEWIPETLPIAESLAPVWLRSETGPRPDVVVNLCETFAGRAAGEICLPAFLESLSWPYTGSPPECLGLVRHKPRTKLLLRGAGLPTPEFFVLGADEPLPTQACERRLASGPLFVKPAGEDASLGIDGTSVCRDLPALVAKVHSLQERYGEVLVESFVAGREFNVGVFGGPEPQALPIAEILFGGGPDGIVTYDAKWAPESPDYVDTPVACPADLPADWAADLQAIALEAFRVCGCRDYARFDFRVAPDGRPFLLEVNANPDPSPSAGLARALRVGGFSYDDFVRRLLLTAAARGRGR